MVKKKKESNNLFISTVKEYYNRWTKCWWRL